MERSSTDVSSDYRWSGALRRSPNVEKDVARHIANFENDVALASVRIESLGRETRAGSDCLRRESDSKINESRAAAERFAIEYQLKYKHSVEYKSLQMPEQAKALRE